jgi:hypothetical protein
MSAKTIQSQGGRRRINFSILVNGVADQFENQKRIRIVPEARELLINTAMPYRDHVEQELASGAITMDFLEQTIDEILENARKVAEEWEQTEIREDTVKESMRLRCPYFPWC